MTLAATICLAVPIGVPGYIPGPGYARLPCSRCQRPAWVGPLQARVIEAHGGQCICVYCAIELGIDLERTKVQPLTNGDTGVKLDLKRFLRAKKRTCPGCGRRFLAEGSAEVCADCLGSEGGA